METNREVFLETKKKLQNTSINNTVLYELLIDANGYKDFTELIKNFDEILKNKSIYIQNLKKILNGEPIQYVLNKASFLDLNLFIEKGVLIPRPETEELVTNIKNYIDEFNLNKNVIGDICSGSGCIALYLKKHYPDSIVYASDNFEIPLLVTKKNKEKLGLDIKILKGDCLNPFIDNKIKIDILISNPPYVQNKSDIDDNVLENEPINAIYVEDGAYFYETYFKNYKKVMNEKFFMAFEINYDQKERLTNLVHKYFDENISFSFKKDFYGKDRFLFIFGGYNFESIK